MIGQFLQALMYPFIFLSLYFQVLLLISFFENKKKIKDEEGQEIEEFPSVTIAVPCWNEEKTLAGTLDSLLALEYPKDKLSIIVVDDGSTDRTLLIARSYEDAHPDQITAITKENGGKHTAVNLALSQAKGELFGCLDADSFVDKKALAIIAAYFVNHKEAMAVTPCIHIRSPKTIIQRIQAIEYLLGVFLRKSFGQLDAIQVTPGPFSIFKREIFARIGNYRKAHNTEDYEITLRMHKNHLKIMNSHKALVYTVGPATFRGYFYQRLRWSRGFLQNSLDYKSIFFKREYGNFGMFTLPFAFTFMFYGLYAAIFACYAMIKHYVSIVDRWVTFGIHPAMPSFDLFYMNTTIIGFLSMTALTIYLFMLYVANELSDDRQEIHRNFPTYFLSTPILLPLFIMIFSRAIFDTFTNRKNDWVLQDTKHST